MSPSAGECDYIKSGVFTHPRPKAAIQALCLLPFSNSFYSDPNIYDPNIYFTISLPELIIEIQ